jgi:hypothetical protein
MVRHAHDEPRAQTASTNTRLAASAFPAGLALAFLLLHLPYLPSSLEDLDSVNFALGIRDYDVAQHQPHPPGYPVFILLAKAVHAVVPSEATALALVSVIAGALGVLAMALLFRRFEGARAPGVWWVAAIVVTMTAPLYWFTAARPLSDVAGLAAALAVQALTLGAQSNRALATAAFGAGLAAGLRSQVVWLTVPLLTVKLLVLRAGGASDGPAVARQHGGERRRGGGLLGGLGLAPAHRATSIQPPATGRAFAAFGAGLALWFVPLVAVSGGPRAYWRALFDQGTEDFVNIQMLWNAHTPRDIANALYYAFIAPWATWPVAVVVLACSALGLVWLWRQSRPALFALAAAFGPYLVFDLLFQESFTGRYALPLVVPMGYLAVSGLRMLPHDTGIAVAVAIAMFDAHIGGTSIAAFAREKAPAFRLLDDLREAAASESEPPVLAMDRRQEFDFRRPIAWVGNRMPTLSRKLPAPPQHEWLEAVKYWNGGGRAPVWFVVDPRRTSIDLVQHGEPSRYRWPLPYPVLVSGARPNEMDWYVVDRPEWYVGEGWALTPEAAGVAAADRRGLQYGAIDGWISDEARGSRLMIGGRNFDPQPSRLMLSWGGTGWREVATVAPGPFLHFLEMPRGETAGSSGYRALQLAAFRPAKMAVEQFDASASRPLVGYGHGWHEQEFNPRTGLRWRWLSERAELQFRASSPRLTLHLQGESPLTYFPRPSRLVVRSGERVLFDKPLSADFSLNIPIEGGAPIVLETDQVFAPADRSRRSGDQRHLGLRIFKCELRALP